MGVDYFPCAVCNDSVCDCGRYSQCDICENRFCIDCFPREVDADDFTDEIELEKARMKACPLCSEKFIPDHCMVEFLLKQLKWSKSRAEKEYRKV